MKRICLTMLILCTALCMSAQEDSVEPDCNDVAIEMLEDMDLYKLHDHYVKYKDVMHPTVRRLCAPFVLYGFGQYEEAVDSARMLLNNHLAELSPELALTVIQVVCSSKLVLEDYKSMGEWADKALQMMSAMEGMDLSGAKAMFGRIRDEGQGLSEAPSATVTREAADGVVPFRLEDSGTKGKCMVVDGKLNGVQGNFIFDTGAFISVIDQSVAEKYGLRKLDVGAKINAGTLTAGNYAIADELKIGNITCRNVLFMVTSMKTGNEEADKYVEKLSVLLGENIVRPLQEMSIDFGNGTITFPAEPHHFPTPNVTRDMAGKNLYVRAFSDGEPVDMMIDTGYSTSGNLGYGYFQSHQDAVKAKGEEFEDRTAGAGGVIINKKYLLPDFPVSIDGKDILLHGVSVATTPPVAGTVIENSILGLLSMKDMGKVTISYKDHYMKVR